MIATAVSSFGNIVIKDEVGLLSKDFVKQYESQYKGSKKEIHVLIKQTIGDVNPTVYGANYLQEDDLGRKHGSGIVILIDMNKRRLQVIIGNRVEESYTDSQIHNIITSNMLKLLKENKLENSIEFGIKESIKVLNEVVK